MDLRYSSINNTGFTISIRLAGFFIAKVGYVLFEEDKIPQNTKLWIRKTWILRESSSIYMYKHQGRIKILKKEGVDGNKQTK